MKKLLMGVCALCMMFSCGHDDPINSDGEKVTVDLNLAMNGYDIITGELIDIYGGSTKSSQQQTDPVVLEDDDLVAIEVVDKTCYGVIYGSVFTGASLKAEGLLTVEIVKGRNYSVNACVVKNAYTEAMTTANMYPFRDSEGNFAPIQTTKKWSAEAFDFLTFEGYNSVPSGPRLMAQERWYTSSNFQYVNGITSLNLGLSNSSFKVDVVNSGVDLTKYDIKYRICEVRESFMSGYTNWESNTKGLYEGENGMLTPYYNRESSGGFIMEVLICDKNSDVIRKRYNFKNESAEKGHIYVAKVSYVPTDPKEVLVDFNNQVFVYDEINDTPEIFVSGITKNQGCIDPLMGYIQNLEDGETKSYRPWDLINITPAQSFTEYKAQQYVQVTVNGVLIPERTTDFTWSKNIEYKIEARAIDYSGVKLEFTINEKN